MKRLICNAVWTAGFTLFYCWSTLKTSIRKQKERRRGR